MRRNYKEEKPEQIELSSYLSRRSITFEDIVKFTSMVSEQLTNLT